MTSFAEPGKTEILVAIGLGTMSVGGTHMLLSLFPVANLFNEQKATVTGLFQGFYGSANIAAMILVAVYEKTSFHTAWLVYAAISVIVLIRTIFFMPISIFPSPIPDNYEMDVTIDCCKTACLKVSLDNL